MQATPTAEHIRDVNTRYHDIAAAGYDAKWGIDFGDVGRAQVLGKLHKLIEPEAGQRFAHALEIGSGTGYFSLNLKAAGVIDELVCTDISPGMVGVLNANATRMGLTGVEALTADADALPFQDSSFDLVLGHAVLHHLPDLQRAFDEFLRVLRPGGRIVFAGEPSRIGDRLARGPKRAAVLLAPLWRRALRVGPARGHGDNDAAAANDHRLEGEVDIHAFVPTDLATVASGSGFEAVQVRGEELVANWFGWFNRSLEASGSQEQIPNWWRQYAFHGYLALQKLDERVLEPRLPSSLFYNLLLTGTKP